MPPFVKKACFTFVSLDVTSAFEFSIYEVFLKYVCESHYVNTRDVTVINMPRFGFSKRFIVVLLSWMASPVPLKGFGIYFHYWIWQWTWMNAWIKLSAVFMANMLFHGATEQCLCVFTFVQIQWIESKCEPFKESPDMVTHTYRYAWLH